MTFVYFTDRDLGNRFPEILRSAGLAVEQHKDHFESDAPDEEWLTEVSARNWRATGARNWIVLTRDRRIRDKPNELNAVIRHRVALLVIIGTAPHADLARAFVKTLPRIERFLSRQDLPFIAKVYRPSPAETARRTDAIDAAVLARMAAQRRPAAKLPPSEEQLRLKALTTSIVTSAKLRALRPVLRTDGRCRAEAQ